MRSHKKLFLSLATLAATVGAAPVAQATEVNVRVEGATDTIFEGAVTTSPHLVRAASDTEDRVCDTTNNGAHPIPGASVTGALDSASVAGGFSWDGFWSPSFNEYFVSRIDVDAQDDVNFRYWGSLLNGQFTDVGGCETPVSDGDEVLWAYDAFNKTKALKLTGPTNAYLGVPADYTVTDTISGQPVEGADVDGTITDANGVAHKLFTYTGTRTVKAEAPSAIRSNGLSVFVAPGPVYIPQTGTSLSLVQGSTPQSQNLRVLLRNPVAEPGYSDLADPTLDGATLRIQGGDTDKTYTLTRLAWKAKFKKDLATGLYYPTGDFKFKSSKTQPSVISSATLSKGRLSISGKKTLGLDLDPNPGTVKVTFAIGNRVRCAVFGGTVKYTVSANGSRRFAATKAPAPGSCPS